jgi:hypothetical protein
MSVNSIISKLAKTVFSKANGENSAWAKPWALQGTGKPW